jgi:carbon monoxide dehydrogenase subunit G
MRLEGVREFAAGREAVYEALTDPELVSRAIRGVESLDVSDPNHWTATVKVSFAPRLKVRFEMLEQRPPEHAHLHAYGKNLGGSATVDTSFDLTEKDGTTSMDYIVEFRLSGILGRLGDPALRPIAEHQMQRLFRAVEKRVKRR